jgi:excisionase family DNA binding protein
MTVKFTIEMDGHLQVSSLDDLAKSLLEAIRTTVRQEVERCLSAGAVPTLQQPKNVEAIRPVALSKAKAAQALGVSVRTLDYCIAQNKIRVLRIGRRVLVPISSIEAVSKRSALDTRPANGRQDVPQDTSAVQET